MTPEARFVTLCVRDASCAPPDVVRQAAARIEDWVHVPAIAARHRVAAFVLEAASRCDVEIPPGTELMLQQVAVSAFARAMLLQDHLRTVVSAFDIAQIPSIVLKGPVLARTVYPSMLLRPYDDLDINVSASDADTAAATLAKLGFHEVPSYESEVGRKNDAGQLLGCAEFHRAFVSGEASAVVELHTDPLQLGLETICEADRWRRTIDVPGMEGALMLCPEDQLVHLSAHVHRHGFERLIWLKDLDLLLRVYGDVLDWNLVNAISLREGVAGSVWYSLRLSRELLAAPIPECELARLQPALLTRALYQCVWPPRRIADLHGFMRRRAVQFHAAQSWRGMLPSMVLMGRRDVRMRASISFLSRRLRRGYNRA